MSAAAPWRLSPAAEWAVEASILALFVLCALLYFIEFSFDLDRYAFSEGYFRLALNSHDHGVYVQTMDAIASAGVEYGLNNDFGIAAIYLALAKALPWLVDDNYALLSFLFNGVVLGGCYLLWHGICVYYGIGLAGRLSFFLNTSLLYFMQLINKDMLTILAFLLAIFLATRRRTGWLLLTLPLLFLVRQQLAVFAVLFVFFMLPGRTQGRMVLAYVATSLAAGVLSAFVSVIGEESMGDGFGAYLMQFNSQYFVGYLLFNPLRVLQYLMDVYASFFIYLEDGGVDVAKILRLPLLVLLALRWRDAWSMLAHFGFWLRGPLRPVLCTIVAYLLAWLMNPTVN
ncbi:MAG TPA: hypothetical protein VFS95_05075, partial [Telluria sp.]|nr:hypothetical protein [Telluria sp.]